ncbi:S-adenosyl-L-methionine-dependent methyltransferase [Planomonospora parontospora subsp. parontospora]|uniref:S-adenosyl-L-methionine-dependent methyltransferase n=2 Tax=Planomonospora parontospora TaxID=58119 RepID=A0AA37BG93_9ACTN|nr:SAM-dependent methyltransferase [Planomonospora parontospora]GGK65886.1 S-adenosyl-L-methionine-dependent methyltransferase [Planomonospora parontospora]GII08417.1 S-adenosyl-L-methionine-dependent methyltransferase [Planomonospora parontospora subsp. parontospora]
MYEAQPSQTAMMAAAARAAHLVVDQEPFIFRDTEAASLLGPLAEEIIGYHRAYGDHLILAGTRAQVTARSHYTERRLAELARGGLEQYVVLGAGLDTFAQRSGPAGRVAVFEVDHPATQQWKRGLFSAAGIDRAEGTFVPVDFETGDPVTGLVSAGFDPSRPALVSWLGVSMYLTRDAIEATLAAVGRFAPGTELVMEYALPPALRDERGGAYADFALPAAAERGEPWLSFFAPGDLSAALDRHGLATAGHVRQADSVDPALWRRSDALRPADLCRLVRATVPAR